MHRLAAASSGLDHDGLGHAENGGQQIANGGERVFRDGARHVELHVARVLAAPRHQLHHEALDALEHQLRALHAPRDRHFLGDRSAHAILDFHSPLTFRER